MNSRMALTFFLIFMIAVPCSVLAQWSCPFYFGCGKRQVCKEKFLIWVWRWRTNCYFLVFGGLYNIHSQATSIDLHLSFIYWNFLREIGLEINVNITWQSFVIVLLPSPLFWIFFLQSNLNGMATIGKMGGGCLIWVTLHGDSSGIANRLTRNVNLSHGITWITCLLSAIASSKTKPNYLK